MRLALLQNDMAVDEDGNVYRPAVVEGLTFARIAAGDHRSWRLVPELTVPAGHLPDLQADIDEAERAAIRERVRRTIVSSVGSFPGAARIAERLTDASEDIAHEQELRAGEDMFGNSYTLQGLPVPPLDVTVLAEGGVIVARLRGDDFTYRLLPAGRLGRWRLERIEHEPRPRPRGRVTGGTLHGTLNAWGLAGLAEAIRKVRDENGAYVLSPYEPVDDERVARAIAAGSSALGAIASGSVTVPRTLWGIPVVEDPSVEEGTFELRYRDRRLAARVVNVPATTEACRAALADDGLELRQHRELALPPSRWRVVTSEWTTPGSEEGDALRDYGGCA